MGKAATGFEPVNGGFADLSLSHLGTPPRQLPGGRWEKLNYRPVRAIATPPAGRVRQPSLAAPALLIALCP